MIYEAIDTELDTTVFNRLGYAECLESIGGLKVLVGLGWADIDADCVIEDKLAEYRTHVDSEVATREESLYHGAGVAEESR